MSKIESTQAPDPKTGAMCYEMALPPDRMEYVCPVCGEKSLYAKEVSRKWTYDLETCRRLFKEMPKRGAMVLDETSFCKKCKPEVKEPMLNLNTLASAIPT